MKFFQSIFFTILCAVVIFFVGWSTIELWPKKVTVNNEVNNLEQKIAETEKSNSELAKLLDYFKSDNYLEREARQRLNYKKPGEEVVFVFRDKESKINKESQEEKISNFQKWWNWLRAKGFARKGASEP